MTLKARITCIAATAALAAAGAPAAAAIGVPAGPATAPDGERNVAAQQVEWGAAAVGVVLGAVFGLALGASTRARRVRPAS
jgi:hypothetical protein